MLQETISPEAIRKMDIERLERLANELRQFLVDNVSKTGGHIASNLGVVELTLSLHKVFNTPKDKIIWDVGHQSYVHKIITGRKEKFHTLRQLNGLSGFPKSCESQYDCFNTGHSSTSISAALGIAKARDIKKEDFSVIAVIGDGALTGGMAFEALNDAGRSPNNLIVILNDNEMSISKNVGGLSSYLSKIRTQPFYFKVKEDIGQILNSIPAIGKSAVKVLDRAKGTIKYLTLPGIIFEELGFKYFGPIDGHNLSELNMVLSRAKLLKGPVLIHIHTKKGKGYCYAEEKPDKFHGISAFEVETGEVMGNSAPSYSDVFGEKMFELAGKYEDIVGISAAMRNGTGLDKFSKKYSDRFFDVGIAEQHAVTFAAGMAKSGLKPVVAIYSSFLQRAYDQILHDVALQNLHVVFAIDRAGIVGEDGETHQGLYDIAFLKHIPNMAIMAPCDYNELEQMLEYAVLRHKGPIAVRYPRGRCERNLIMLDGKGISSGKGLKIREGSDLTIIAAGNMVETAIKVADELKLMDISAEIINPRFIKPLDSKLIIQSITKTKRGVCIEDACIIGGLGSSVLELLNQNGVKADIKLFGFPDEPIIQGSRSDLFKKYGIDAGSLVDQILKMWRK
jgi:1-deoxy-D-xylulose-5-phosphate synthase